MKRLTFVFTAIGMMSYVWGLAQAADPPKWLDDQTVAVARLSVDQANDSGALLKIFAQASPPISNELKVWEDELKSISGAVRAAGGKEIVVVLSMSDAFTDQPLLVVPGAKSLDLSVLKSTLLGNGILNPFRRAPSLTSASVDGDLVIGTKAVVERVSKASSSKMVAVDALGRALASDNVLTITCSLNRDQRRVLAEMVTTLPPYLGTGPASGLVSEIETIAFDVTKTHDLFIHISGKVDAIESRVKSIEAHFAKTETPENAIPATLGKFILKEIVGQKPRREKDTLTWKISAQAIESGLGDSLAKVVLESDRMTGMQRIKLLGLALHNYYSAFNKFPSVSTSGGKPRTLSWRVDLLPFLDESQLYAEFHRDEPWDSEHNKKLISRMPDVFRCPQSKHSTGSGMSTFILPVHEKAMWVKDRDIEFKDIEDGSSNTIMIFEASDEFAQIWTRPEPFEVNLTAPQQMLGGHFEGILFGAGNGSASLLPKKHFDLLPALITRSGGEVIEF